MSEGHRNDVSVKECRIIIYMQLPQITKTVPETGVQIFLHEEASMVISLKQMPLLQYTTK